MLGEWLREAGLVVHETPGWLGRGAELTAPIGGVVCHHTASAPGRDMPTLLTLIHGRPDLAGPLAQIGGSRSGEVWLIAAGKANHAGGGSYPTVPRLAGGNSHLVGIEWENSGLGERWTRQQLDAYVRVCGTLCTRLGLHTSQVISHYEWAKPPGRKPDPAGPWEGGGDWYSGGVWQFGNRTATAAAFRTRVHAYREGDDMTDAERALLAAAAADAKWCREQLTAWFSLPGDGRPYGDVRRKLDAAYVEVADESTDRPDLTLGGRLKRVEQLVESMTPEPEPVAPGGG